MPIIYIITTVLLAIAVVVFYISKTVRICFKGWILAKKPNQDPFPEWNFFFFDYSGKMGHANIFCYIKEFKFFL
jgi:hypothetical protein